MTPLNLTGPLKILVTDLMRMRETGIPFLMRQSGGRWLGSRNVIRTYGKIFALDDKRDSTATIYVRARDVELVPYIAHMMVVKPTNPLGLHWDLIAPDN